MEKGYFSAAWGDITHSPGWLSKILRLGLLCLVPVFGVIVLFGYLYGWARDIAWNVHRPMPDRIFGNEDGQLYKRGFFILVVTFVFSLIPLAFNLLTNMFTGFSLFGAIAYGGFASVVGGLFIGAIFALVGIALSFFAILFEWVGSMRTALYVTLSSGFQIGKIWAMIRYDFVGLLKIFGMWVLSLIIVGIALAILIAIAVIPITLIMAGILFNDVGVASVLFSIALILFIFIILVVLCLFASVLIIALIARALGYWTRQFQINLWGGQEDPMPFERVEAQERQQYYDEYQRQQAAQAQYQQGYQQPMQAQYQQPTPQAQSFVSQGVQANQVYQQDQEVKDTTDDVLTYSKETSAQDASVVPVSAGVGESGATQASSQDEQASLGSKIAGEQQSSEVGFGAEESQRQSSGEASDETSDKKE